MSVLTRARSASEPAAAWLLDNYDYARAQVVLGRVAGQHSEGPYFVSASTPLSSAGGAATAYVIQDLSSLRPDLARSWVKEFVNQTAQQRYWESRMFPTFGLKLRQTLARVAQGFSETLEPLEKVISWKFGG
jgi:hypothetical protein